MAVGAARPLQRAMGRTLEPEGGYRCTLRVVGIGTISVLWCHAPAIGCVPTWGETLTASPRFHLIVFSFMSAALSCLTSADSFASGRLDLAFGTRLPRYDGFVDLAPHSVQPAISVDGSITPRGWPVGITAYGTGAADSYEGSTLEYPGFADWLSADYRLLYGETGGGLEKAWRVGQSRLSIAGGLMASSTAIKVSRDAWSNTTSHRANGQWLSVAGSQAIGERFDIGVRARYTWEKYASPEFEWLKAGGLQLGLMLGFRLSGG